MNYKFNFSKASGPRRDDGGGCQCVCAKKFFKSACVSFAGKANTLTSVDWGLTARDYLG